MKRIGALAIVILVAACAGPTATPTPTETPEPAVALTPTAMPTPSEVRTPAVAGQFYPDDAEQLSTAIDAFLAQAEELGAERPEPIAMVLRMERFTIAPTYNTNRMIFRDKSFKRNAYVYHL